MMGVIVAALTILLGVGVIAYYLTLTEGRKKSQLMIYYAFRHYKEMRELASRHGAVHSYDIAEGNWRAAREALSVSELEFYRAQVDEWSRGRGGEENAPERYHILGKPFNNLIRFKDHQGV